MKVLQSDEVNSVPICSTVSFQIQWAMPSLVESRVGEMLFDGINAHCLFSIEI